MVRILIALTLLAAITDVGTAQGPPDGRRAMLQQRVFDRFVEQSAGELHLGTSERERLGSVLRHSEERRRALMGRGRELRGSLSEAVRNSSTPDAEFRRILDGLAALRAEEMQLWQDEQKELAQILSPRQQARFLMLRARFAERVLELRQGKGGQGGRPGLGPPPPL